MSKLVLLIDDDEDELTIFSMAMLLAGYEYEYAYASSAQQAMQLMTLQTPSYIFVDLNMPKVNGLACVKNIRKLARYDQVPVIMYSNGVNAGLMESAIAAGADNCIKKESTLAGQASVFTTVFSTLS